MTAGFAFFLFAVAVVVVVVIHQSLSQRQRRMADQSSRLELLSSISTLEEVQKELFRRKTLAAMGELAGGVSHDLRNPLAAIRNATHLLRRLTHDPGGKAEEYISLIDRQVERADGIITNLLDFSRTATTEPAPVDLREFFDSLLTELPLPPGIEVHNGPHDEQSLRIDRSQLRQIVMNILNNAVQAIGDEGTIGIQSAAQDDRATLRISNSGPPIDADALRRIFDPLFSTKAEGFGLGLAIVKNLVQANGGKISVETSDEGSTFILDFDRTEQGSGETAHG